MSTNVSWRWALAGLAGAVIAFTPLAPFTHHSSTAPPSVGAGEPANLDFTLKDMDGHDVTLSSFRGHPMLINFWATWCGPCRLEMPHLVAMAEKYRSRGLIVLGISIDDDPADLRAFAPTMHINYPLLVGKGHEEMQEAYDALYGIPISWFIRGDGTVALKQPGYNSAEWFDQQIRALF